MGRPIGFSTGSLAKSDYRAALSVLGKTGAKAVELSALREHELAPLLQDLAGLDLSQFEHASIHAPSRLIDYTEEQLVSALLPVAKAGYPIVVHADIITDDAAWKRLGRHLCIENMDKRKSRGRTWREIGETFAVLPKARFCLDVAHARQIDPTMSETIQFLRHFGDRLEQLHVSELDGNSKHNQLSYSGSLSIQSVRNYVPVDVPIILEHEAEPHELENHMTLMRRLMAPVIGMARSAGRLKCMKVLR
jgi:hypothetical protein